MSEIFILSGPTAEPKSGGAAKQLVILLHGLGANGDDLFGLVPLFQETLPDAKFVSLNAPFPCDMAPFGLQWFSLQDRDEEAIVSGIERVVPSLNHYIDSELKKLNIEDKDLILLGFSQGTMLSMYTAFRRPEPIGGVLAYSGALIDGGRLKDELRSKPPVCLVHGQADEVVPFVAFEEALAQLQTLDIDVNGYSSEDLGHGIDPAGVEIGKRFMASIVSL